MTVNLDDPLARQIVKTNNRKRERSLRGAKGSNRSLQDDYFGNFKVLVVRVSDQSHSPTFEAEEISDHVFNNRLTMVSHSCHIDLHFFDVANSSHFLNLGLSLLLKDDSI